MDLTTKLTPHFKAGEFATRNNDGSRELPPEKFIPRLYKLAEVAEKVRAHFGNAPVRIVSGYRGPEHNVRVRGAKASQHLQCRAMDIRVQGVSPDDVADVLEGWMDSDAVTQGGLGRYDTFTHYDFRGTRARWDERSKHAVA